MPRQLLSAPRSKRFLVIATVFYSATIAGFILGWESADQIDRYVYVTIGLGMFVLLLIYFRMLADVYREDDYYYISKILGPSDRYSPEQLKELKIYRFRKISFGVLTARNDYGVDEKFLILEPQFEV